MGSWWSGLSPSEALAAAHRALVADPDRNTQIVADLTAALHRGRNCLVLTRRIAHVETLTATAHRARTSSLGDAGQHVRHRPESSRAPPTDAKAGDGVLVIGTTPFVGVALHSIVQWRALLTSALKILSSPSTIRAGATNSSVRGT